MKKLLKTSFFSLIEQLINHTTRVLRDKYRVRSQFYFTKICLSLDILFELIDLSIFIFYALLKFSYLCFHELPYDFIDHFAIYSVSLFENNTRTNIVHYLARTYSFLLTDKLNFFNHCLDLNFNVSFNKSSQLCFFMKKSLGFNSNFIHEIVLEDD